MANTAVNDALLRRFFTEFAPPPDPQLPPYDETRVYHIGGMAWWVRVDNTQNQNGLTFLYARCEQWYAANVEDKRMGRPARFTIIPFRGDDPESLFAQARAYTARQLGIQEA